jgi:hypothetical protein
MINQYQARPFGRDAFGRSTGIKVERCMLDAFDVIAKFAFDPDVPGSHDKAKLKARSLARRVNRQLGRCRDYYELS